MGQNIDEKIYKRLQQSQINIPAGYEQNIDKLLNNIKKTEKYPVRPAFFGRTVAVLLAVGLLFSSVGVYATVNYVQARMEAMGQTEMKRYRDGAQNSDADRDIYSRKFSESEAVRIEELRIAYQSKGVYPKRDLQQIETGDTFTEYETIVFSIKEGAFYLPERELTDEEILELIDFYYKRDYSIHLLNKDIVDNTRKNLKNNKNAMSEEEALKKAVDTAKEILVLDVSEADYSIETLDLEETMFILSFKEKGTCICEVVINVNNGAVIGASNLLESDGGRLIGVFERDFVEEVYQTISETVNRQLDGGEELKNAYARYYENIKIGTVEKGMITYLFELKSGAGYVVEYNCKTNRIAEFNYLSEYGKYEEGRQANEFFINKSNLVQRRIQLYK